jgi:hypothetical protein
MRHLLRFGFLLIALAFVSTAQSQAPKNSLEQAHDLFMQYKLTDSHKMYDEIAGDTSYPDSVRTIAYERLAEQDAKFYTNYTDALAALEKARAFKINLYSINLLATDVNREAGKYLAAIANGRACLKLAKTSTEKVNAALAFAKAVHDEGFDDETHGLKISPTDLREASAVLNKILEMQPGNSDASELLIGISILLKDRRGVLAGWKSYYLVDNEQNINQVLKQGYAMIKPVLLQWRGQQLTGAQMSRLALGLAATKFFDYADYFIRALKKQHPEIVSKSKALQDAGDYAAYIENVKKVNAKIYPEVARGKKAYENEYDSLMDSAGKILWRKLSFTDKHAKFDPDTFYNTMNRRYDMEGYSGNTVGYYGMLMGHVIHKELKQINQYGYSTKFTYISVDRLMSRDFTSWYGTTNVGGWGDSTTIIQVRKAYMTEPYMLLTWVTDSTAHRKILADIAAKKQADYATCKNDSYAEPKFLASQLKYNTAEKIYKRLTASGLKGMERNIAFIDEILRLTIASTVFAHEGRHAIDQLYFQQEFKKMSDDERELRAKYSEVIYSLDPKMAFTGSILGSDLDENTNHGKANKRFRKVIVDWMSEHKAEIKGLDPGTPLLMQFDLLTDPQLIAICKSADPLAKERR